MTHDDEAREVQERMARLRREIADDVEQVTQRAREMTDWTFYVRKFPWAAAALAAAAGFLLVPKKQQVVAPTQDQLEALARSREFAAAATSQLKPSPSMVKGLAATLAAMAGRAALAYISEQIRNGNFGKPAARDGSESTPQQKQRSNH